jgi:O-acetyl-ADP-ribose deacetylase (regulator of RNase III)
MQIRVNAVTITISRESPFALAIDALALEAEPNLRLPAPLLQYLGNDVYRELSAYGMRSVGDAVITAAGEAPFRHLIHAVTPRWGEGAERGKLRNAILATLELAEDNGVTSLALPPFSVGPRGFPLESCATIMLTEIVDFTFEDLTTLKNVTLCCETDAEYNAFAAELARQQSNLST